MENLLQNKAGKTKATSVPTTGMVIAYQKNDILIGNIRPYLRKVWLADCEGGTNGDVLTVQIEDTEKVLPQFLYYVLSSEKFFLYDIQNSKGAKMPRGSKDAVMKFEVPLPPLEIQREIVRILDNFTKLTARKMQYSFYREKMLDKTKIKAASIKIGNLGKWSGGKTPSMAEKKYWNNGTIPWVSSKDVKQPILSDTTDHITNAAVDEASMTVYPAGSVAIVTRSGILRHTFPVTYIPFETTVNQDIKILVTKEGVSSRYVSHALQAYGEDIRRKTKKQGGTVDSLDFQKVLEYQIPVPSFEIQNRIVEVLDNFEKICSDLNIGLPAEIEARQKQYEYYRDKLLTFAETGNTILSRAEQSRAEQSRAEQSRALIKLLQYVYGCVWLELGDVIVSLNTGLNPRKFFKLNTEDATNYYITIREMKDGKIVPSEKTDRMNDEARKLCNNRSNLEVGDVLFSGTGTIGETAVIEKEPSNWNIKEGVYAIKPNQTMIKPMYLRYILMTDFIKKEYMKKAAGGTVQSVPMGELKKIRIPVPSLQEQNRIVGVLKQLDDLCNDLASGLPTEIEARQKQYEYYRDKLLNFKELN